MRATIFVEGGNVNDSASLSECRKAFRTLMEKAGLKDRMPTFVACGGRQNAYKDFKTAHRQGMAGFVALLVDSEDPIDNVEEPWVHLAARPSDVMPRPEGATEEQALVMATCMESWIVTDRAALAKIYRGGCLQESALPALQNMENRNRHDVQDALVHATRNCSNAYRKGKRSFKALGEVDPARIRDHLPSFARIERILNEKL